jgi:hypothetical protein
VASISRHTSQGTRREFVWDCDDEAKRIRGVIPAIPIRASPFETITDTCRRLDKAERADKLIQLTLK